MTTDIYSIHAQAIASIMDYLGDACPSFTWNNIGIRILPGSISDRKNLAVGGFNLTSDLRFVVLASDLPNPGPAARQLLTYNGELLRIESIEAFAGQTLYRFECNNASQGA